MDNSSLASKLIPSYVELNAKNEAVAFVGPDAIALARAITLRSALRAYRDHRLILARGVNGKRLTALASSITHQRYRNCDAGYTEAITGLTLWIEAMKSAIPLHQPRPPSA